MYANALNETGLSKCWCPSLQQKCKQINNRMLGLFEGQRKGSSFGWRLSWMWKHRNTEQAPPLRWWIVRNVRGGRVIAVKFFFFSLLMCC